MALTLGCWIVHEVACKAVYELWTNSICCPELLRKQYVNPLCMTVGWQPTMVKYCMMHTLHLGICHWVNGGALLTLIHHNFFGSSTAPKKAFNPPQSWLQSSHIGIQGTQSMAEIMHLLNRRFLDWCRLHGINPGQTFIGTAHLHQEDWAELRLKAYGSRVFTAFMAVCLQVVQREHGHADLDLNLITVATQQLSTWMLDVEFYPLDLTDAQSEHIYATGFQSLGYSWRWHILTH